MEIVDYLRIARRRIWVLVGIPLAAALAATVLVILSPHTYTATATVAAPALVGGSPGNQYTGSQAVNQFVSAFQSTAQGPQVRQAVSAQTGIPTGRISSGLTVGQVGASSAMSLTYTSDKRAEVIPLLTAVTKETLKELFQSQVDLANTQIADAQADISKANAAILAWEQKNKLINPPQAYQAALDRLGSLQQQQALQIANGKPSGSAALASQIAAVESQITRFGPLLADFDVLAATRDSATAGLTSAQQNLLTARAQLDAANPAKVAYVSGDHEVSQGSVILTKVLPITGAALFAAVALIAILELLSGARMTAAGTETEREIDGSGDAHEAELVAAAPAASPAETLSDNERDETAAAITAAALAARAGQPTAVEESQPEQDDAVLAEDTELADAEYDDDEYDEDADDEQDEELDDEVVAEGSGASEESEDADETDDATDDLEEDLEDDLDDEESEDADAPYVVAGADQTSHAVNGVAVESDEIDAGDEIDHEVDDFDHFDDSDKYDDGHGDRPLAVVVR